VGLRLMKKLKIGYWPLSSTLNTAGDRRRLVFWANARGHSIVTDLEQDVDVIVASENSDFNSRFFGNRNVPLVFDLVDAYLSPLNLLDDLARGFAKCASGQLTGKVRPFSHHIREFCVNSDAIICSSVEQEQVINVYNSNTHVILDSHEEIPFVIREKPRMLTNKNRGILWEGQPATIAGVNLVSPTLVKLSKDRQLDLNFITDQEYFRFLNKFSKKQTRSLFDPDLSAISDQLRIISWSPAALAEYAEMSILSIIPIDLSVPMQRLKPENRLLIMWRLGLPCITSPSAAYIRVSEDAGASSVSYTTEDWTLKISALLDDPVFAHNQILAGQNYIRENHNTNILLNKWDTAFESVLG
jgi:hypothetical protein